MGIESELQPELEQEQDVLPLIDDPEVVVNKAKNKPDYNSLGREELRLSAVAQLEKAFWDLTHEPENVAVHDKERKRKRTLDRALGVLHFISDLYEKVPIVAFYMRKADSNLMDFGSIYEGENPTPLDCKVQLWMGAEGGLYISSSESLWFHNEKLSNEKKLELMLRSGNQLDKKAVKWFANLTEWDIYRRFLLAIDSDPTPSFGERLRTLFSRK